jgi:hypothetical protein
LKLRSVIRRQEVNTMRFTLRSSILTPMLLAAAVFTATSAMAETHVNVPFNFKADGKSFPAGSYTVNSAGDFVKLDGVSQSLTWVIHPGDPAPTDKRVILKFDQAGSDHVLRSIQYGNMTTSRLDKKVKDAGATALSVEGQ